MNGRNLALGLVAGLAAAGLAPRFQGSRSSWPFHLTPLGPDEPGFFDFDSPDAWGTAHVAGITSEGSMGLTVAIYTFSSRHKGGGRAFLSALRPFATTISAHSIGERPDVLRALAGERVEAPSFWLQMAREGLVDHLEDDEGLEVNSHYEDVGEDGDFWV